MHISNMGSYKTANFICCTISNNQWSGRFSLSYNWPTFDEWRIWEHDRYVHTCQEKQTFFVVSCIYL